MCANHIGGVAHCQAVQAHPSPSPYTLSADVAEDGEHWTLSRHEADAVAAAYQRDTSEQIRRKGHRIAECGRRLIYSFDPIAGSERYKRTLAEARLCRVRTCPICAWRRAERLAAQVGRAVQTLCAPGGLVPLMLTLTVRNCDVAVLPETLAVMLHAWSKLRKRKFFIGLIEQWTRSLEITRGRGHIRGDSHPHMHCILMATPDNAATLLGVDWAGLWAEVMQLEYKPQCHIMPLDTSNGARICEALKYTVKPHNLTQHAVSGWLARIEEALADVRVFACSQGLRITDDKVGEVAEQPGHDEVDDLPNGCPRPPKRGPVSIVYNWTGRAYIRGCVMVGQGAADIRAQQIALARAAPPRAAPDGFWRSMRKPGQSQFSI